MAIPFQSNLNNMVATGIQNAKGTADNIASLSGGTMPESVRTAIASYVIGQVKGLDTTIAGNIPLEVYTTVADMMLPFTPSLTLDSLSSVLQSNSVFGSINAGDFNVDAIITNQLNGFVNLYEQKLLSVTGGFDAVLGALGISDQLASITEKLTGGTRALISASFGSVLSVSELAKVSTDVIYTFMQGSGLVQPLRDIPDLDVTLFSSDFTDAMIPDFTSDIEPPPLAFDLDSMSDQQRDTLSAVYVKSASGTSASLEELQTVSSNTRGTIAGTISQENELPSPNPYIVGDQDFFVADAPDITSVEELSVEMGSIERPISEMVVHWTESYTNAYLSGFTMYDFGSTYHLVIRRDGSVERGLPLAFKAPHCHTLGHNNYSIGVCFVGGLNVSSGSDDLYEVASARSLTLSQYNSFYHIMQTFFVHYPGGQVLGHMDIDADHVDPGFDVQEYAFNNFGKQSMYTDAFTQTALSPSDLLEILEGKRISSSPAPLNKNIDRVEQNF